MNTKHSWILKKAAALIMALLLVLSALPAASAASPDWDQLQITISWTDENGEHIKSTNMEGITGLSDMPEAVSDTSVPQPLPDTSDTEEGNTMESEGITNEEAGLE